MSREGTLTMLKEKFENEKTGEKVEGITVIIDGKIKEVFDIIMCKSNNYKDYSELLNDVIFRGLNEVISEQSELPGTSMKMTQKEAGSGLEK